MPTGLFRAPIQEAVVSGRHLDALIEGHGRRRRQQQRRRHGAAGLRARLLDQTLADPLALAGLVDGEIGEIAAEAEIGERAGEAHQLAVLPGGHDEVGVGQHPLDAATILDRTVEARLPHDVDVIVGAKIILAGIDGRHSLSHLLRAFVTSSGRSSGVMCPLLSITTSRALAMSAAISSERGSGVAWSWRPTMTTVGTSMSTSNGRLSGRSMMACCSGT